MKKSNRRDFIRIATLSGAGLGLHRPVFGVAAQGEGTGTILESAGTGKIPEAAGAGRILEVGSGMPFVPRRAASWWTELEDILWPQKAVVDKIKRRAENFAKARIDTAINFGFHVRFDFSNYFGQLHGYFANVCEELHKYDIRFMEHYSCNHVERPRGEDGLRQLQKTLRHHVLLFHDPVSAPYAQYEGHYFNDICEIDIRDGSRGYEDYYKLEVFCHNNPGFLDMHKKYLLRLMKEVPFDGIEVDDMCDYAGLTTCGCKYCRERLKKDYGREIPPFGERSFWGDTSLKDRSQWGNYENPAFRDWLRMKADSVADHLKMIKETVGAKPVMTCCSNAGPIVLNPIALNLEKMAPYLDFFMLENVGINYRSVDWMVMDAEAMYQKDVAEKKGNSPAITISYMVTARGGYLGWCLGRFWGVANWSSTLYGKLEEDPADAMDVEEIMSPYNNWDILHSDLNDAEGRDLVEVRLVTSSYCRENGWRGSDGLEQWDRVRAWSAQLVTHNVGYRLLRVDELGDGKALASAHTPLILDGVACVSESQFKSIGSYLSKGGTVWMALPFGTHDEKGFSRKEPLSKLLSRGHYKNLVLVNTATAGDRVKEVISKGRFKPMLRQLSGNTAWAVRIRFYKEGPAIHFLNRELVAVPHPTLKEASGLPILKDFYSEDKDNKLVYEFDAGRLRFGQLSVRSPELKDKVRPVVTQKGSNGRLTLHVNLEGVQTYAVAQNIVG